MSSASKPGPPPDRRGDHDPVVSARSRSPGAARGGMCGRARSARRPARRTPRRAARSPPAAISARRDWRGSGASSGRFIGTRARNTGTSVAPSARGEPQRRIERARRQRVADEREQDPRRGPPAWAGPVRARRRPAPEAARRDATARRRARRRSMTISTAVMCSSAPDAACGRRRSAGRRPAAAQQPERQRGLRSGAAAPRAGRRAHQHVRRAALARDARATSATSAPPRQHVRAEHAGQPPQRVAAARSRSPRWLVIGHPQQVELGAEPLRRAPGAADDALRRGLERDQRQQPLADRLRRGAVEQPLVLTSRRVAGVGDAAAWPRPPRRPGAARPRAAPTGSRS